jgi:HEAT repeat protein
MSGPHDIDPGLVTMIADYMEKGFLENIVDMFRHDSTLYSLVGELIQDERVRVRIGVTALMEELRVLDAPNVPAAVSPLLPLLDHENPVVRGDVSNILGIIADETVLPFLEKGLNDDNPNVRLILREAIEEIRRRPKQPFLS